MTTAKAIRRGLATYVTYRSYFLDSSSKRMMSTWWRRVEPAPKDPILGVTEAFLADRHPHKVNVGVVSFRSQCSLIFGISFCLCWLLLISIFFWIRDFFYWCWHFIDFSSSGLIFCFREHIGMMMGDRLCLSV